MISDEIKLENRLLSRSDIGEESNSLEPKHRSFMTKTELKKAYAKKMLQANQASGRREAMDLYKEARSIKKKVIKSNQISKAF